MKNLYSQQKFFVYQVNENIYVVGSQVKNLFKPQDF